MSGVLLLRAAARLRPRLTTPSQPIVCGNGCMLPLVSLHALPALSSGSAERLNQARTAMTKRKKRLIAKKKRNAEREALGIPKKLPDKYIPKDTPIVNSISREDRERESAEFDKKASEEMRQKIQSQGEVLRFNFTGLQMSDRVRKLFELTNGNQSEIIKAQKQRGMELFQLREGDTGSSAVQVIALTTRIQQIQTHLAKHKKDKHSKRGLDALYVRRRKLLDYMERREYESYRRVVKTLGLIR
mmetsp:Transcript_30120/g.61436  ORF Transcript_30120/g.61436 Transcript_30120/m.61436 type:complete len:244 (-) Transcript_30120:186-917(-)|eukprot:CAMPEP_0183299944 /NCGR_PEP_ID=MMETSP0160_2-20130417/6522_1 /TAXON_ID=2839 ORGANISM="Odontella Sinensis, Strain Grunow 1884" /NCGR_SAMPLE_ID=MMETSP0160_2 /ASSEMBLY_ACC=CAM_ASM_000250 /LENGTH=243 /DNA_ID=CAMNT_0025462273 /DNA_START=121 /DNA_END=852 /DNA_ORIENTATION=-